MMFCINRMYMLLSIAIFLFICSLIKMSDASKASLSVKFEKFEQLKQNELSEQSEAVDMDCPVCKLTKEDYAIKKNGEQIQIFITRCNHYFCQNCMKMCIKRSSNCPICRGPITGNLDFELLLSVRKTASKAEDYSSFGTDILLLVKKNYLKEKVSHNQIFLENLKNSLIKLRLKEKFYETFKQNIHNNAVLISEIMQNNDFLNEIIDKNGNTPLLIAIMNENFEISKFLIDKGANPNVLNSNLDSAIHIAVQTKNLEITKLLLDNNVDITATSSMNKLINLALSNFLQGDIFKLLIEKGIELNLLNDPVKNFILKSAIKYSNIGAVEILVEKGANVNFVNSFGECPLVLAMLYPSTDIFKLLLLKGANANVKYIGNTLTLFAIKKDLFEIFEVLIERVGNPDLIDEIGKNLLIISIKNYRKFFVKYLIKMGANVNRCNLAGESPLFIAIRKIRNSSHSHKKRLIEIVKLLLSTGVNVNAKFADGNTPLHAAARNCSLELVKNFIEENAADIDVVDKVGNTALHLACEFDCLEIVEYLVTEKKFNVNARNGEGLSPLNVAIISGDYNNNIVKFLLKNGAC